MKSIKQIKSFIQIGRKQHNKQLLENDGLESRAATAHRQQQRLLRAPPANTRPNPLAHLQHRILALLQLLHLRERQPRVRTTPSRQQPPQAPHRQRQQDQPPENHPPAQPAPELIAPDLQRQQQREDRVHGA